MQPEGGCHPHPGLGLPTWSCLQARLRTIMIEMVLATDMKQHVQLHTALQTRLAVNQASSSAWKPVQGWYQIRVWAQACSSSWRL